VYVLAVPRRRFGVNGDAGALKIRRAGASELARRRDGARRRDCPAHRLREVSCWLRRQAQKGYVPRSRPTTPPVAP